MKTKTKALFIIAALLFVCGLAWEMIISILTTNEALSLSRRWELFWMPILTMMIAMFLFLLAVKREK